MYKLNHIVIILISFFLLTLIVSAEESASKFLPKTKDMVSEGKKNSDDNSVSLKGSSSSGDVADKEEDSEDEADVVDDPSESFRLVAIYLVEDKARALIKNLDKPEDPAKEFQVGDYVDEQQTFSISKILLNPTVRVELIDPNGLSYIMKPKNTDNGNNPSASKPSKSSPSYASGNKTKIIKRATSSTVKPASDTSSAVPVANINSPEKKKEETSTLESAIKNDSSSQSAVPALPSPAPTEQPQNTQAVSPPQDATNSGAVQSPPPGALQTQTTASPPKDTSMTDSMMGSSSGDSRPSNPFGE